MTPGPDRAPHGAETDDLGTLERAGELGILRYRRALAYPPAQVWRALTEPGELSGWFPTTIEGERLTGAALRFSFPADLGIEPMSGEMLTFEPPSAMEFTWGGDVVRFEVRPAGSGTELHLTVTFPEYGKAARDGAGWHVCLEGLNDVLDGVVQRDEDSGRWRAVHPSYVARFGPEASVLGPPQRWEDAYGSA